MKQLTWYSLCILLGLVLLPNSYAQEEIEGEATPEATEEISESTVESSEEQAEAEATMPTMEEMVVTGSRLRRTTFESISPLQIIDADTSREAGLVDAADIIQESTSSGGAQIDLTFSGYVLDEGPGASTANLRGLSADRTLILINGRRMAPGGVEGAPSNPDLNLVPGSLVANYDFLLDGASSIYGSDAIAGVVNIKLRKDFDGFEIRASTSHTQEFGDASSEISATWGYNGPRGFVGVATSLRQDPLIRFSDAPFTQECNQHLEIDENGMVRTEDVFYLHRFGVDATRCRAGSIMNIMYGLPGGIGTLYYTPGRTNGGWANFSESHLTLGGRTIWFDSNGNGRNDVDFTNHWRNYQDTYRTLYNKFHQTSHMAYGEYTFEGDMNVTAFFEALYTKRDSSSETAIPQLFPRVPALNPFNPCNPLGEGVDCGLARDALLNNPVVIAAVQDEFGCVVGTGGSCDLTRGPSGPVGVGIVVSVDGDRHQSSQSVGQMRWVAGVSADLPALDIGTMSGWVGEASVAYTSSKGLSHIRGIRGDRLNHALGVNSLFGLPCSADLLPPGALSSDVTAGCVPVNLFAPSLWDANFRGHFATQEEENYLFDVRAFDTRVSQRLISMFASGGIFSIPDGQVIAGFGYENRIDTIDSIPNSVSAQGQFFGFSADQGAAGDKTTEETYAELEFPLLQNRPLAEQLTLNISGRNTSDEYYGSHSTYSGKIGYRPVTSLLIRATKGTSYRSPNLRNSFLLNQTGFLTVFDPCVTPDEAIDEVTNEYIPANDRRLPIIKTNCELNGVDPTRFFNNGFAAYNVEVAKGGALDLNPETSTSVSAGIVFEQPFTNAFDLTIGGSYYKIDVDDTIIEPSASFIIADCYLSPTSSSPFCSRIRRVDDPDDPEIDFIHEGFINRDNDTVRGVDINVSFNDTVTLFDRPFEINVDYVGHKLIERSTLFINQGTGDIDDQEFASEWRFPTWKHTATLAIDFGDYRFTYRPRYIGNQGVDPETEEDNVFDEGLEGVSDTCEGPPNDVLCKDIITADPYMTHTIGLRYAKYNWDITAALQNLTDEAPPKVDASAPVLVRNNIPLGAGYDLLGRTLFVSATYRFGGQ